ncbi:MAG: hypothetical protein ACR2KZ_22350 [Segetibacter sp.]
MKLPIISICFLTLVLCSCQKETDVVVSSLPNKNSSVKIVEFVRYTIPKGAQYCDQSNYLPSNYQQLSFIVRFDSSAIYQTQIPSNQGDINTLFGFSDNNAQHHDYSARFGWRWSDKALRLYAYVYNKGVMHFEELGTIEIGADINCTIKVKPGNYVFTVNGRETVMPREATTATAEGYKLFPFFGGDEVAPHAISIWIKESF